MIVFTDHAVQRYIERVIPGRDDSSARRDLDILAGFGKVTDQAPAWAACYVGVRWLTVGATIAFPLRRSGPHWVAVTCLTRRCAPKAMRYRSVLAERELLAA
jgi:hypothetical protein